MTKYVCCPSIHSDQQTAQLMRHVIYALLPMIAASVYSFGWGVISNLLFAIPAALAFEALTLRLRQRPALPALADGSAVLTAVLLAIALPPMSPWWLIVVGCLFAIFFAKQLYGGLGYNLFNPAMIGYVVLLISFPQELTNWRPPVELQGLEVGLLQTISFAIHGIPAALPLDALTMATPLDTIKTGFNMQTYIGTIQQQEPELFGYMGGNGWELLNAMALLGGLYMLARGIITWHVPVAMLSVLFVTAMVFWLFNPEQYATPQFHLFSGGVMLGAFFIATDPVTCATSNKGRLIYGAGIGLLEYIIRVWGGYPDGIAFSVLLMNMTVPLIDYYTKTKPLGTEEAA